MALSAALVWEIGSSGSALNGGGFRAGASGTDYSQQDAAQLTYTDLVIGATNTQLTSAANPFTSAHVGNLVNITGGTGFTTGRYEVASVSGGVATMDRAVGTASSTSGSGKLGGCLDHPSTLAGAEYVAGNRAFLKSGTAYTTTTTLTFATGQASPANNAPPMRLIGYTTTRGDGGKATIQLQTTTSISLVTFSGAGWWIDNIVFDANGLAGSTACTVTGNYFQAHNCVFKGFGFRGLDASGGVNGIVHGCELTSGVTGTQLGISLGTTSQILGCWVHDLNCTIAVISIGSGGVIARNVVSNITGSGVGLNFSHSTTILFNTVHKTGGHGISANSGFNFGVVMLGNILSECGGFGVVGFSAAGMQASPLYDGNAFYLCTSGNRSNMDDTTVNPQDGVSAYTNIYDKTLSASPFVDKTTNNYALNNTAGGGVVCRATAFPAAWPGLSVNGYADMGAIQHQDAGGGGIYTAATNVRSGTDRGDGVIGTLIVPVIGDVEAAIGYGAGGTEFTGTFAVPVVSNVISGVGYGAGGTEFTGTATTSGLTLSQLETELTTRGLTTALTTTISTNLDATVSSRSTFAGGPVESVTDKTGFKLSSDGLDTITTTEPTIAVDGAMTTWNFRKLLRWSVGRFANAAKTPTTLTVKTLAGATATTQTVADDSAGVESTGVPS